MGQNKLNGNSGRTAFGALLLTTTAEHLGLVRETPPKAKEVYVQHENTDFFGIGGCAFPMHVEEVMNHGK